MIKYILLCLSLLLPQQVRIPGPGGLHGGATVLQHTNGELGSTNHASVTATFGSNLTSTNNYILVTCAWYGVSSTASVTDNAAGGSNTYADTGSGLSRNTTGGTQNTQTFKAKIVHGSGTTPTITCSFSPNIDFPNVIISEVSGADPSTFVDSSNNAQPNPAGNATFTAGTVTTVSTQVLLYAVCAPNSDINSAGVGFLSIEKTPDSVTAEISTTNLAAGTYSPKFKAGSSADNDACNVVAIKAQ